MTDAIPLTSLDGGVFLMGDDGPWSYPDDGEQPVRPVEVAPFALAPHAVTNADFAAFVDDTGFVTDAERHGWSFVFAGLLPDDHPPTRGVGSAPWWRQVDGASWRRPEGPASDLGGRWDHPVVHISHRDAEAWCAWAGLRLPTEAEWEFAARANTTSTWPWGEDLVPDGVHHANVFQGEFPVSNTAEDGWVGTCPVDAFIPNAFGMWNMIGNVWEWTAGPDDRGVFDADRRVIKGGSYLCHESYCRRFRPGARSSSTPDSSTGNTGFRVAGAAA